MKKIICFVLVLTFCVGFACQAFAAEAGDEYVSSPGTEPTECVHGSGTKLVGAVSATCTTDGYTGDLVCSDCGEVLQAGTVIPKFGHRYVNGSCEICGVDESNPQTGDNSMVSVWMIVMVAAAAGLVAVTTVYRKKFANQ